MRAAMYYNNSDVRLEEVPKPEIGENEILVKVIASGICGSDVLEWYRIKKAPLVLGHEISGEIAEVGKNVKDYKVGQRVFVSHHVPCNECIYCKRGQHTACETLHTTKFYPGGFAEYLRVPEINIKKGGVLVLPGTLLHDEGTFIEPLGCVLRGQRVMNVQKGNTVLVLGSGISGLLHIMLAKAKGAGKVIATDVSEYRLNAAKKLGADLVIDARENVPEKVKEFNEGRGADKVIVCTGAMPAMKQALESVDRGGSILFFATTLPGVDLPIPMSDFWRNQITVLTSYAAAPIDLEESMKLIAERKINVTGMITHRVGLADAGKGFKLMADAGDSLKVIVEPQK